MTAVILWKAYRQQRMMWLAILLVGLIAIAILLQTLGQGIGWRILERDFRDSVRTITGLILFGLAVMQGLVTGAALVTSDKEDRTIDFLDTLSGLRGPVFVRLLLAGVLITQAQCLILAGVAIYLGVGPGVIALYLSLCGLDALAWGLLAGAICRTGLVAVLAALAMYWCSWAIASGIVWLVPWHFRNNWDVETLLPFLARTAIVFVALWVARRFYCRGDLSRAPGQSSWIIVQMSTLVPASWRAMLWLTFRQGRWVLVGSAALAVALRIVTPRMVATPDDSGEAPLYLWFTGLLALGLICGLAMFVGDQNERCRFLAAQRLPAGRIWTVKLVFWGLALLCLMQLAGVDWLQIERSEPILTPTMLAGIWPIFGFALAQLLALLTRRAIVAAVLAAILAPTIAAVWVPSLVFSFVPTWRVLFIPALMLISTRLLMWPWFGERLQTIRPIWTIAATALLVLLSMVGFLWYQYDEIPDVGEPFDVAAFTASLPSPAQNEAGPLLQGAVVGLREQVRAGMAPAPPGELAFPGEEMPHFMQSSLDWEGSYPRILQNLLEKGWPKRDQELGEWLDALFQGQWATDACRASELPLGMLQDPRLVVTWMPTGSDVRDYDNLASLFAVRGLQMQAKGDSRGGLQQLTAALALSRQVKNFATAEQYFGGDWMQRSALLGFQRWLEKVGPDKQLLQSALAALQRHAAAEPDPANSIKADYLQSPKFDSPLLYAEGGIAKNIIAASLSVPWEAERRRRVLNAVTAGRLRELNEPAWRHFQTYQKLKNHWYGRDAAYFWIFAALDGLPPKDGPGSKLTAAQWGEYIVPWHSFTDEMHQTRLRINIARAQAELGGVELLLALALYRADHGTLPGKLEELAPGYLARLPVDPWEGGPFGYRISEGEIVHKAYPPLTLAPGQAVVWSEGHPPFYAALPMEK